MAKNEAERMDYSYRLFTKLVARSKAGGSNLWRYITIMLMAAFAAMEWN